MENKLRKDRRKMLTSIFIILLCFFVPMPLGLMIFGIITGALGITISIIRIVVSTIKFIAENY